MTRLNQNSRRAIRDAIMARVPKTWLVDEKDAANLLTKKVWAACPKSIQDLRGTEAMRYVNARSCTWRGITSSEQVPYFFEGYEAVLKVPEVCDLIEKIEGKKAAWNTLNDRVRVALEICTSEAQFKSAHPELAEVGLTKSTDNLPSTVGLTDALVAAGFKVEAT